MFTLHMDPDDLSGDMLNCTQNHVTAKLNYRAEMNTNFSIRIVWMVKKMLNKNT